MIGHALITAEAMPSAQDQVSNKQPDRSKSSGSLPILNAKKHQE